MPPWVASVRSTPRGGSTFRRAIAVSRFFKTEPLAWPHDRMGTEDRPMTASGTFDVKVTPQPQDDEAGGPFGRLFLDKQFHGELQGASRGQMLASGTGREPSGGYVALELVTGVLNGKRGSFVLQHKGTMRKGAFAIEVSVVPDSGTVELAGISG